MANLECKKPKPCDPVPKPEPVPCSPAFDLCVGDRIFKWDGFCPTVERSRHTPDGTYTSVTVVDGCIVGYGYAPEATYTPPYCNPNPARCQESGAGGVSTAEVSPNINNSLTKTSNGLYARTYIQGGDGVTVSGVGTVSSPYKISSTVGTSSVGVGTIVGRNGVVAETSANNVNYIGLTATGVARGTYDVATQFTVDEFGRITAAENSPDPLVTAGEGLQTSPAGDSITVEHPTVMVDNTLVLGAYTIRLNNSGHITGTERGVNIAGGVYNLGAYNVGINAYGGITSIEQREDVMSEVGEFTTVDGKVISFDQTGRLTSVSTITGATSANHTPLPLRDMYKVNLADSGKTIRGIDIYGSPITHSVGEGKTMTIPLPPYVVDQTQVQVNGAATWRVIPLERLLEVKWGENTGAFTISFRG